MALTPPTTTPPTTDVATVTASGVRRAAIFSLRSRYFTPILFTSVLIPAHLWYGILESYVGLALAIVVAILAELVLGRLTYGTWPHPASAYMSGVSVGMLVRSPVLWPYALTSLNTILSKYVLRARGRHIWNPSNFGISTTLFLAPAATSVLSIQWGNQIGPMIVIWVVGSFIIWRVRLAHICAAYVLAFLVFAFVRCAITGNPFLSAVAPLTGPMYQLYVFLMITDPKTQVRSIRGQCLVAVLVAFVEMLLRLGEVVYAPFYALFLVGPASLLVQLWRDSRTSAV